MASGYSNLNKGRESLYARLKDMGLAIETYIHPDARVYTSHPLGEGSIVLPGAVIEPHVRVGVNTMIWCNVTLAHHCEVGDHCWIASGAVISGKAAIGRNTFVGVNATIVNEIAVSDYNIIGASALISKNTKPGGVYLARSGEEFRYSSEDYVRYFGV
jgi:sugar O-acyltransferase (sialic acid O-acetyltransferase NeuD family)